MKVKAVILDLDGLMVDSEPMHQRAFEVLLLRHGIDHKFSVEEYGRYFVGIPVVENIQWVVEHFDVKGRAEEIIAEREAIYEALIEDPANLIPMPGVFALLEDLGAQGLPLAVASGSPRNQVNTILRGLGVTRRFRVVVGGDDVSHTKPAPDVYVSAVKQLGVAPADCIAIEDSATGVTAAQAAGLRVIVVPNGYTAHQDLSRAEARVKCLDEVMALID